MTSRPHRDIIALLEQLPESIIIPRDPVLPVHRDDITPLETTDIPLRKIGSYFVESRLVSPLGQELEEAISSLGDAVEQAREINSLLTFSIANMESDMAEEGTGNLYDMLGGSIKKMKELEEGQEKCWST